MGLWDNWHFKVYAEETDLDDGFWADALKFEECQRARYIALRSNLPTEVSAKAKHEIRVMQHYVYAASSLIKRWVYEKKSSEFAIRNLTKGILGFLVLSFCLSIYPILAGDDKTGLFIKNSQLDDVSIILGLLLAALSGIVQLNYLRLDAINSLKLDRMVDGIAEVTGCTMSHGVIRMLHDYQDTPIYDGHLHYIKALVVCKYFEPEKLVELTDEVFEREYSIGIMRVHWNERTNK